MRRLSRLSSTTRMRLAIAYLAPAHYSHRFSQVRVKKKGRSVNHSGPVASFSASGLRQNLKIHRVTLLAETVLMDVEGRAGEDRSGEAAGVVVLARHAEQTVPEAVGRALHAANACLAGDRTLHADGEDRERVSRWSRARIDIRQARRLIAGHPRAAREALLELVVDQHLS